jgi:hypothetical protein
MTGLLALVGALVAAAFAMRLRRQFRQRRRHHALAWSMSFDLYAIGMVALAVGLLLGWSPQVYGVYWFTGALVNVPLLAVGELHLLAPSHGRWWWTLAGGAALWAIVAIAVSQFDAGALAMASADGGIPLGADVLGGEPAYAALQPLTLTGTVVVLAGTVWSAVRRRRPAVLLIALGVLVAASSSAFVRSDLDALVPVALTSGVAIMYTGFRATSARRPESGARDPHHQRGDVPQR